MTTRDVHGRGEPHGPVTLIGRGGDAADSARDFLERNGVELRWIDLDRDPLAAMLPSEELRAASLPLAIFADGGRLEAPRTYIERTAGLDAATAQQARESRHWHADLARRAGLPTHPATTCSACCRSSGSSPPGSCSRRCSHAPCSAGSRGHRDARLLSVPVVAMYQSVDTLRPWTPYRRSSS